MSKLKYLKGIRTRFQNALKHELEIASSLISYSEEENYSESTSDFINNILVCQERIQKYIEKLELQSEKVCEAVGEDDQDYVESIIMEDSELMISANKSCDKLKVTELSLKNEMQKPMLFPDKKSQEIEKLSDMNKELQTELISTKVGKSKDKTQSVKLPRLDIINFHGNRLQWLEFWQSFENSVHNNDSLSDIDKFNYLRSKLTGEARCVITGLSLSNENYTVAVDLLKERFGNIQETIDLYYNQLINLKEANESTESLRVLTDSFLKHLRSLEAMKQNINQDLFVSVLKSKLPSSVILHLEIQKGAKQKWTVSRIMDLLDEYVSAREKANTRSKVINKADTKEKSEHKQLWSQGVAESLPVNPRVTYSQNQQCRYCSGKHWSDECPEYRSIGERKRCLKGSCFKCLKTGHMAGECKSQRTCVYCKEKDVHHRSLCPKKFPNHIIRESVQIAEDNNTDEIPECGNALLSSNEIVLMQTAQVYIKNPTGYRTEQVRVLLDSGSQRTYITEKLAKSLDLERTKDKDIQLVTFGSEKAKVVKTSTTKISLQLRGNKEISIFANVVPTITGTIQRKKICVKDKRNLDTLVENLNLADTIPTTTESGTVDLLIGNDYYLDIVTGHKIEVQKGLYLLSSRLGWILTGRTDEFEEDANDMNMLILTFGDNITKTEIFSAIDESVPVKPNLEDFGNLEAIGIVDKKEEKQDEMAMNNFRETLAFKDDRYYVTWPWKNEENILPENRMLAVGRLRSLVSKLKSRPDLLNKYNDIIQEQLGKDIIEKVDSYCRDGAKHYIPHHAVIKPDRSTTKLRVVYDASAKTKPDDKSLNECLYRGPVLLRDLCGILIRFRMQRIGIVSDIEKAFLQVGLQQSQRDVTRFLWLKDPENVTVDTDNIQEYRFCRVPFGVISSPFLLGATVNYHLDRDGSETAHQIKRDIYMDNVISGVDSVPEAIQFYTDSKKIFSEAGMNLREWASNNQEVEDYFPEHDKTDDEKMKVLGLEWNKRTDTLNVKPIKILDSNDVTKRNVLKQVAAVFDPLGLFSPVTLKGKLILQLLWNKHLDWDEQISEEDVSLWKSIMDDLQKMPELPLPRCVKILENNDETSSLVCFCDASGRAYAAVIYFVQQGHEMFKSDVIFTKTRLAPSKKITIPRLELMAVLIGVRAINYVRSQIFQKVSSVKIFTDSMCTLGWIESKKQLPVFVRNRVEEIKKEKEVSFHFVKSKDNPADLASRSCSFEELRNSKLWWSGPVWLQNENQDPMYDTDELMEIEEAARSRKSGESENSNKREECLLSEKCVTEELDSGCQNSPMGIDVKRFSSKIRMIRVTATVLKFIDRLKGKPGKQLTSDDIKNAEEIWIKYVQRLHFQEIRIAIQEGKKDNLQAQLGVFLDEKGILRCKGRLENSDLTESARFPILLPKKDRFSQLVIEETHKMCMHSGVSQTLSAVRQLYWIPQGRASVRKVLRECVVCKKVEGHAYKMPPMAPLPYSRVTESPPFTFTGLDYMGPLYIKDNKENSDIKKVWVCLLTCMVTRAVHLEIVTSMSTESFLNALRRFIAVRGKPDEIVCDNALQFKLASETTNLVWGEVIMHDDTQSYFSNQKIKWKFIVELAPWMGGFYERMVGVLKRCLKKSIGRNLLDNDKLQTVLKEAEAVINNRHLVYVGEDINSTITLTPSHFLCLNPRIGIPVSKVEEDEEFSIKESSARKLLLMWRKGQKLVDKFWTMWREEYLTSLRERGQSCLSGARNSVSERAEKGDVVLIKDNLPRGSWRYRKVTDLIESADGKIRSARVQTKSGNILNRPLKLLYPFETSELPNDKENSTRAATPKGCHMKE